VCGGEGGCMLFIWDMFSYIFGKVVGGDIGDVVDDYYYWFCEDVVIMCDFGLCLYCFFVVWLCIIFYVMLDVFGLVNDEGLDFYCVFVVEVVVVGIESVVMFYYWDLF